MQVSPDPARVWEMQVWLHQIIVPLTFSTGADGGEVADSGKPYSNIWIICKALFFTVSVVCIIIVRQKTSEASQTLLKQFNRREEI